MKKPRFTDSQIMAILKEAENGVPVPELCREHGMSSASFYIYGLPLDCKHFFALGSELHTSIRHLTFRESCAQMGNPLTLTSTSGRSQRSL